jgi:hypothetical protein
MMMTMADFPPLPSKVRKIANFEQAYNAKCEEVMVVPPVVVKCAGNKDIMFALANVMKFHKFIPLPEQFKEAKKKAKKERQIKKVVAKVAVKQFVPATIEGSPIGGDLMALWLGRWCAPAAVAAPPALAVTAPPALL